MLNENTPVTREDLLRAEAASYRERLKERLSRLQSVRQLQTEALVRREEGAMRQAESYLLDLNERAHFRDRFRALGQELKESQAEILKRQGEAYRERMRRYLRPEELNDH